MILWRLKTVNSDSVCRWEIKGWRAGTDLYLYRHHRAVKHLMWRLSVWNNSNTLKHINTHLPSFIKCALCVFISNFLNFWHLHLHPLLCLLDKWRQLNVLLSLKYNYFSKNVSKSAQIFSSPHCGVYSDGSPPSLRLTFRIWLCRVVWGSAETREQGRPQCLQSASLIYHYNRRHFSQISRCDVNKSRENVNQRKERKSRDRRMVPREIG